MEAITQVSGGHNVIMQLSVHVLFISEWLMMASFMQAVLSFSMLAARVPPGAQIIDMLQNVWMQPHKLCMHVVIVHEINHLLRFCFGVPRKIGSSSVCLERVWRDKGWLALPCRL